VLRQGVSWHDGSPFSADDVVATMNLLTDPSVNSSALSAFKGIFSHGNIEKVDDHTVTFHLDGRSSTFPTWCRRSTTTRSSCRRTTRSGSSPKARSALVRSS